MSCANAQAGVNAIAEFCSDPARTQTQRVERHIQLFSLSLALLNLGAFLFPIVFDDASTIRSGKFAQANFKAFEPSLLLLTPAFVFFVVRCDRGTRSKVRALLALPRGRAEFP